MRYSTLWLLLLFIGRTPLHGAVPMVLQGSSGLQEPLTVSELLEQSIALDYENPEEAKVLARKAVELAMEENDESGEIKSLYQLGIILLRQGHAREALPNIETGLKKSLAIKNPFLSGQGNYHLSRYYETTGNFPLALEHITRAKTLFEDAGRRKHLAYSFTSLGRIYQELGNYREALTSYFESLRINEELENRQGISVVKTNIGNVFLINSRFKDAIQYFSEALSIDKEDNNLEGVLVSHLNLGATYSRMADYKNALVNFNTSLELANKLNYIEDQAIIYGNIGAVLRDQGNPEQALVQLFKALELKQTYGFNQAHTLNDLAETYLQLKLFDEAASYSERAIEVATARSDPEQLVQAYRYLSAALDNQNQHKKAYTVLLQSNKIRDSLFSIEQAKQLSELHISYETEKKEERIDLLTLEKQAAEFRTQAYLVTGILGCLLLFLLFYSQRVKTSKNRQLFQKEHEIALMKSKFFSNVSHEFRTPLTLILGPIEIIRDQVSNPKLRDYLDVMQQNAKRLLTLINQLLDLSKLESGQLGLEYRTLEVVALVKGVSMTFTSLMETKNILLSVSHGVPFLSIQADQEKLETILINLLSNAFKHTPEDGKISVSIDRVKEGKNEPYCEIVISDNGRGIPEEALGHIFDRFYQGTDAKMALDSGYGIGLALCRELVELHKGTIKVYSKIHEGTRVVIRLPVETLSSAGKAVAPDPATPVQRAGLPEVYEAAESSTATGTEPAPSRPLLLVIEDNGDVMYYLEGILAEQYDLIMARDGESGIAMALEQIPDLVISDVMMPKANGYQVCSRLKQDEKTSHIPIVLLTAKATPEDKIEGFTVQADAYLTKPFFPKELLIRVQNLIASRQALRERYNRELLLKPEGIYLDSIDEAFLKKVKKVVDDHLDDESFNMEKLGAGVGMSRSQIHRKLQALTNQSATRFIRAYRLERAMSMLRLNSGTVSEIGYAVGFSDPSYFSKCFHEHFGMTPSQAQNTGDQDN